MPKVPDIEVDEIGIWSEVKLEIIRKYAQSYSEILSKQSYMNHCCIDAFAGLGYHKSKATLELVKGSPQLAVETEPPFKKYYFVDIDATRVSSLNKIKAHKPHQVEVFEGDSNPVMTHHYTHVGDLAASQVVSALPIFTGEHKKSDKRVRKRQILFW
jgi:three-Cys-motif partner protein